MNKTKQLARETSIPDTGYEKEESLLQAFCYLVPTEVQRKVLEVRGAGYFTFINLKKSKSTYNSSIFHILF